VAATSIVKARKGHFCDSREAYAGCQGIKPGTWYRRSAYFSSDEFMEGHKTPLIYRECQRCAEHNGKWSSYLTEELDRMIRRAPQPKKVYAPDMGNSRFW
jgi:hypothetical protein